MAAFHEHVMSAFLKYPQLADKVFISNQNDRLQESSERPQPPLFSAVFLWVWKFRAAVSMWTQTPDSKRVNMGFVFIQSYKADHFPLLEWLWRRFQLEYKPTFIIIVSVSEPNVDMCCRDSEHVPEGPQPESHSGAWRLSCFIPSDKLLHQPFLVENPHSPSEERKKPLTAWGGLTEGTLLDWQCIKLSQPGAETEGVNSLQRGTKHSSPVLLLPRLSGVETLPAALLWTWLGLTQEL